MGEGPEPRSAVHSDRVAEIETVGGSSGMQGLPRDDTTRWEWDGMGCGENKTCAYPFVRMGRERDGAGLCHRWGGGDVRRDREVEEGSEGQGERERRRGRADA